MAGVCVAGVAAAGAQGFTLEQVMSAPFNSELRAAPAGRMVAWGANERGARNLWVADLGAAGFAARRVTAFTADDGMDISGLTWTADGKRVLYVRGGDFEFPGH